MVPEAISAVVVFVGEHEAGIALGAVLVAVGDLAADEASILSD